jgi:hypothetical protein
MFNHIYSANASNNACNNYHIIPLIIIIIIIIILTKLINNVFSEYCDHISFLKMGRIVNPASRFFFSSTVGLRDIN